MTNRNFKSFFVIMCTNREEKSTVLYFTFFFILLWNERAGERASEVKSRMREKNDNQYGMWKREREGE